MNKTIAILATLDTKGPEAAYLKEQIQEDKLIRAFDNSTEALTHIWKTKYAKKRIESLIAQGRVSKESHFYDDIIYLNWEETKKKYLFQVGR